MTLVILLLFPSTEGRAENLDLFSIYSDPLILYVYAASLSFFIALCKVFKLLGYIRQNNLFSLKTMRALKSIKYCAIGLIILIVMAGLYIKKYHSKDDDPAGFIAICIVTAFVSLAVAIAVTVFEKIVQNRIDIKSQNE